MNTKNIRLVVVGILAGMAMAALVSSNVFNEAEQAHQSKVAWCAGSCQ